MPNYTFRGLNMNPVNTLPEAYSKYQMDIPILKLPLKFELPDGREIISPYHEQIVNGNTFVPIWVVGIGYIVVEYPLAFSLVEPLVTSGTRIVGGGCPNRGERAYLVLENDNEIRLSSEHKITNRFLLSSSHDGTSKIEIRMTPWSDLTGTAITFDTSHPLAFKHTRNVKTKIARASKIFKSVNDRWNEFKTGVQKMVAVSLTEEEAKNFIESIFPAPNNGEASTRLENMRNEILTVYRDTGIGTRLPQCRGTLFGLVQAVVEWSDIKRTVRKSKKRDEISAALDTKLIGSNARDKQKAWAMALYLSKHKGMSGALRS